jgi:hypothetical protein
VDVAWEVAEDGEADVDQEVGAAAGEEEDGDGRNWGNLSALEVSMLEIRTELRGAELENLGLENLGLGRAGLGGIFEVATRKCFREGWVRTEDGNDDEENYGDHDCDWSVNFLRWLVGMCLFVAVANDDVVV